jgi:hypothetical protein
MDAETIEKLRSLGYVAGAVTQKPSEPARDPKDMILSYEKVNAARTLVAQHRIPEAVAMTDSVLAQTRRYLGQRIRLLPRAVGGGERAIMTDLS